MLLKSCKRVRENQYGGILVLGTVLIPILLINLVFAIDLSRVFLTRQQGQRAVDAAALSAAAGVPFFNNNLENNNRTDRSAQLAMLFNGTGPSSNMVLGQDPLITLEHLTMVNRDPDGNETGVTNTPANGVRVTRQYTTPLMFGPLVGVANITVTVQATAILESPSVAPVLFPVALFRTQTAVDPSTGALLGTINLLDVNSYCDHMVDITFTPNTSDNGVWYDIDNSPDARTCMERVLGRRSLDIVEIGQEITCNNGNAGGCFAAVVEMCHTVYTSAFDEQDYTAQDRREPCIATKPWVVLLPVIDWTTNNKMVKGNRAPVMGFVTARIVGACFPAANSCMRLELLCNETIIGVPGGGPHTGLYLPPILVM